MPIPKALVDIATQLVTELFDDMRDKYIKPSKALHFNIVTLADIYRNAVASQGGTPMAETANGLTEISSAYIDSTRARTQAALLQELSAASIGDMSAKDLDEKIEKIFTTAESDIQRTVETEAQRARSVGILEGITHVAVKLDDKDPTIIFITKKDNSVCVECKRVHVMPNGDPRAWKMSQVSHHYHVRGEDLPSHMGLHPHCRCSLTYVPPGFGFKGGRLAYISEEYDLYKDQHGE